jgi:integrase
MLEILGKNPYVQLSEELRPACWRRTARVAQSGRDSFPCQGRQIRWLLPCQSLLAAGLELKAHPHTLRHACGYALANKGHDTRAIQDRLGHRSITSIAVYTALAPNRFKDFWRE